MEKNWQIKPKAPEEFIKQFPEYPDFVLGLLWDREIKTQKEIDEFFNPDYETDLRDPFLFKGMKEGAGRIERAIKNREKIVIYGDYDTDGICASAILYETFKVLGAGDLDVYIPDRFKEGYGLNLKSVKEIAEGGAKLLITVDCGITDVSEVDFANSLGLEVIITDHHLVHGDLPKALAIIDARQDD
ncbi:MAG: DHH family phosphoesterase, partial [Candidatus Roizmanbacteria bacterium]|nr:DHH family phosphoesterase [Candidatus Roizmanbacteria bacterium]